MPMSSSNSFLPLWGSRSQNRRKVVRVGSKYSKKLIHWQFLRRALKRVTSPGTFWACCFSFSCIVYTLMHFRLPSTREFYQSSLAFESLLERELGFGNGTGLVEKMEHITHPASEELQEPSSLNSEESTTIEGNEPPAYLPLAQYFRNLNSRNRKPSVDKMAFGAQRSSKPDLEETVNDDLLYCAKCETTCETLDPSAFPNPHEWQLSCILAKVIRFYGISSLSILPCGSELRWVIPVMRQLEKYNPDINCNCLISTEEEVTELKETFENNTLNSIELSVYNTSLPHEMPKVDLLFTWDGLEQYNLDEIEGVFKHAARFGSTYTMIANKPGHQNAKLIETSDGTFSIQRSSLPYLNVRAYPFGFGEALRVIPFLGKQLLLYKSPEIKQWD